MTDTSLIRRSPVPPCDCSLARSFELIGDFQADLDVPRSVLSNRLAGLVDSGIMDRREYREGGQRTRIEYPLTKMGQALGLPFIAMTAWGDRWLADGRSAMTLRSKSSGQKLRVALVDEAGKVVGPTDVETVVQRKPRKPAGGAR
jgi:DNA-binding HxlR family transcriptional regulator